jgi:integrase
LKRRKEEASEHVLSPEELHRFVHGLPAVVRNEVRRRTLWVLPLTGVRRKSLAQAMWSEFNFNMREWQIPAEHDKERRTHIVPLTEWVVEELCALKRLAGRSVYILPKCRNKQLDQPSSAQLAKSKGSANRSDATTQSPR